MKLRRLLFTVAFIFHAAFVFGSQRAVLVHNTIEEIDACKGKLQLKLVRIWGGDEEKDEQKFFSHPRTIAIDAKNSVYICDQHNHNIKVYDSNGKYMRTIGRKGRGPGDLYAPGTIDFSPTGDLWVGERGGRRVQCFNKTGKSKTIFRHKGVLSWIGVTAKNEVAVFSHQKTFESRTLLSFYNSKGKLLREIGVYHDKSKTWAGSERIAFSKDDADFFYAANTRTPVIRKYSKEGRLLMALTFETPFETAVKIRINAKGDEIEKPDDYEPDRFVVKSNGDGVVVQRREDRNGKKNFKSGSVAIRNDSQSNLYVATFRRMLTEKEINSTRVTGTHSFVDRSLVDYDIVENIDVYRLLVFNLHGKIIAESQLTTFCGGIYISKNRLFIVDGFLNQRILEYEMSFKK
jgi:hypothetical protein